MWAWVAPISVAFSLGALAMALTSLRGINPSLRVEFGPLSVVAGGLAGYAGWTVSRGFWRLGRGTVQGPERARVRRQVILGLVLMAGVIVLGFVMAAGGIPESRRSDMIWGGSFALAVLGTVGWVITRLAKIFGAPDEPEDPAAPGPRG